jgi:hypothetical protein
MKRTILVSKLQTTLIALAVACPALWSPAAVAAQQPVIAPQNQNLTSLNAPDAVTPNATAPDIRQTDPRAPGPATTGTRGLDAASGSIRVRPDDRAGIRAPGGTSGSASARPDDSPGVRGIGVQTPTAQDVLDAVKRTSPNQVGLAWQYLRDTGQISTPTTSSTPPRPDDRAGIRGGGPTVVTVGGNAAFDWGDWGVGAVSGIGLTLLTLAGISIVARRRTHGAQAGPAATTVAS